MLLDLFPVDRLMETHLNGRIRARGPTQIDVAQVRVSSDRLKVTLSLRGWRAGYVTAVRMVDVTSAAGESLWHDTFYYSLIRMPD